MVPRLPPAPMISTVSPGFSLATLTSRFQAVGDVAHHHGGVAEIEARPARRTVAQAGTQTSSAKPPGRLMPIMPSGPV